MKNTNINSGLGRDICNIFVISYIQTARNLSLLNRWL